MKLFTKYGAWVLIIIPVIVFFWLFFKYTVNAPINDDYSAILDFLNTYVSTPGIADKAKVIVAQANEHRLIYNRFWILLLYKLNGVVNFNTLALIGNLALVVIFVLFYKKFSGFKKPLILFLPVAVLLFNISFCENITFAMAALSNFTIWIFIILSIWFLAKPETTMRNTAVALLFFIMAIATQGGGLFILPVAFFILILKKEYKLLFFFAIPALLATALYFYGYYSPDHNAKFADVFFDMKIRVVLFFFSFLGNSFSYFLIYTNDIQESTAFSCLMGFILFTIFLFTTYKKYYRQNMFVYALMLLLVISAAVTAYSRASFGLDTATASRYRINGVIFLICIYFWALDTYSFNTKKIAAVLALTTVYYLLVGLNQIEYLYVRERATLKGIVMYNEGKPEFLNGDKNAIPYYVDVLKKSAGLNIYHFPKISTLEYYYPFSKNAGSNYTASTTPDFFSFSVGEINTLSDSYLIEGWGFLIDHAADNQKIYIGLQNSADAKPVFYTTLQTPQYDLNPYFKKRNLRDGGYIARIKNDYVKPGENTVWIMNIVDGQTKITLTDKKIIK